MAIQLPIWQLPKGAKRACRDELQEREGLVYILGLGQVRTHSGSTTSQFYSILLGILALGVTSLVWYFSQECIFSRRIFISLLLKSFFPRKL